MSWVEIIVDRKIRDAQEEGAFDDLPGKGRPLKLDSDPRVPAELRMAYRLMREANVLPDWIEVDREVRRRLARWEERLAEFVRGRERDLRNRGAAAAPGDRALDTIRDRFLRRCAEGLRDLNREIDRLNLIVPTLVQQRAQIPLRERMEELEARFPRLLPGAAGPAWEELLDEPRGAARIGNRIPPRRRRDPQG